MRSEGRVEGMEAEDKGRNEGVRGGGEERDVPRVRVVSG